MQLGILGAGTMGEIIARALLEREVFRPQELVLAEQDADVRADKLEGVLGEARAHRVGLYFAAGRWRVRVVDQLHAGAVGAGIGRAGASDQKCQAERASVATQHHRGV